jgi:hypothetical protein
VCVEVKLIWRRKAMVILMKILPDVTWTHIKLKQTIHASGTTEIYTGYILILGHSFEIGNSNEKVITTFSSASLSCKHLLWFRSDAVMRCGTA